MRRRGTLIATVVTLAVAAFAASQAAADRVRIRAWPHDDFLRLVFDWDSAVDYTAAAEDGVLSVVFDRPIEADLGSARKNLGAHVDLIEFDESGRGVRVGLLKDYSVRHFVLNGSVVVDLVSPVQAADPEEISTVAVRLGEHDTFTRAVFDWPESVGYAVDVDDGAVTIRFDESAQFDLAAINGRSAGVRSAKADGEGSVMLTVPEGAEIRHFRDGPRIAVDVVHPASAPAELPVAAAPVPKVTVEAVPGVTSPSDGRPAFGPPRKIGPAGPADVASETEILTELEPAVRVETEPAAEEEIAATSSSTPIIPVAFEPKGDGGVFRFDGGKPWAKAVFTRSGWTWVIVDRVGRVNVPRLRIETQGVLEDLEQLPHDGATVLRFRAAAGINPVAIDDGEDWLLDVAERPLHPLIELIGDVNSQAGRPQYVFQLDAGAAGRPLTLGDPEIGDELQIVPVTPAGHGVAPAQRSVDLEILASAQGIVLVPRRDAVDVRLAAGGLAIDSGSDTPLHLTTAEQRIAYFNEGEDLLPRLFLFEEWRSDDEPDFNLKKQSLQQAVVNSWEDGRDERRMDLARFFFAHGMFERSLGVLSAIARDETEVSNSPDFLAMRGASRLLLGDLEGAALDLNNSVLDDEPELGLWRAALLAESGESLSAAVGLRKGHPYASRYPDSLRVRFALLGADIGLRVEEPGVARSWLASLDASPLQAEEASLVRVLDGKALLLEGEPDAALEIFEDVIKQGHRRSRAIAMLGRTELLLERGDLTIEQAIEALESVRFVWRGDSIEFGVLRRLGELQIDFGSVQEGMQTLKRATSNFEQHPHVGELTARMQEVFEELFLSGEADELAPVKAIALFNEFRELTPPGEAGDKMIRQLADRLASVDLLDQAAGLLQHQVEFRISDPAEKAAVGVRLAGLRLLDRQPAAALEALDGTRAPVLPEDLGYERQIVRARALAEIGQIEDALSLLELTPTEEAARLRASVLWDIQDWSRAALALGDLVVASDELTENQARDVLRRAIALLLDGQSEGLEQMRRDFGVAMLNTPYAIDFRIVTSSQGSPADIQAAVRRVASVDDFQDFIEQYRGRIAGGAAPAS